ncbi:MAG: class I SAM-dependent methyltransferase [Oscillatoriales cyanobacterium]|nr:MAG: class I SAM-dependent methyltransferase [Oscillatoriales cyanobacterium]
MTAYHESIIDQFTRQAVPFSNLYGHTKNQESLDLLMKMASVSDKDTVLDVACGPGIVACAFAAVSSRVTGIDLTPAMLEQAQILAEQKNLTNLSWLQGDIETLRILIADVAMPPEKVDAYNYIEKLRDPSHTRALTLEELPKLVADANLQNVKLAFYKVELELEQQLAASFPNPGDDDKLRQIFREDIGVDSLGIGAHWRGDKIHYAVPIAAIVGEKAKLYSNPK